MINIDPKFYAVPSTFPPPPLWPESPGHIHLFELFAGIQVPFLVPGFNAVYVLYLEDNCIQICHLGR